MNLLRYLAKCNLKIVAIFLSLINLSAFPQDNFDVHGIKFGLNPVEVKKILNGIAPVTKKHFESIGMNP